MTAALTLVGALIFLVGTLFLFFGGLGLFRMPDTYNRIQAGTKAVTLGTLLTLLGAAFMQPGWWLKLLLIAMFVIFTNPLSSQVLARAAHRAKVASHTGVDHLAEDGEDLA